VEVLIRVVVTMCAVVVPLVVGFVYWMRRGASGSLEEILASDKKSGGALPLDPDATSEEGLEAVKSARWPEELPGLERIWAYEEMKEAAVASGEVAPGDRTKLRHALMDRCQAHVAWLLRLEKEQRSMDRLSRRGMISTSDYQRFTKFADELDAEVNCVREEAAWLCDDQSKAEQAADEIWRIAVQIWQQRRQQQSSEAKAEADKVSAQAKERDEGRRARVRAAEAKRSMKGLKGGFLSSSSSPAAPGGQQQEGGEKRKPKRDEAANGEEAYEAARWPAELPCAAARARYEKLKKQIVTESGGGEVAEGVARQRLRQALMERCQHHVPFVRFVENEQARARAALERSKWRSGKGAPSSEDLGKIQAMDALAKQEMELVQAEAEWLGDPSGEPGMGDRIWQHAFEIEAQLRLRRQEQEKQQRVATEKTLKSYASRDAKPWPKQLPGAKQRAEYETQKAQALRNLPQAAQHAMLQGRPALRVVGPEITSKLRAALVHRAVQCVPLIQRLQAEAAAVKIAADRGQVDDDDLANFRAVDDAVKKEVDAVKAEADWLADDSRKMADSIWAHAFKVHAEKRQAVLAKLQQQQQQQQQKQDSS